MSDVKTASRTRRPRRGRRRARRGGGALGTLGQSIASNTMIYTTRWNYGQLVAGTSGIASASDLSPSIANSVEYSTINSLFSEVKLLSAVFIFSPSYNTTTSTTGRLLCGTQMQANQSTHATPPLALSQVVNLTRVVSFNVGPGQTRSYSYRMAVPRNLEYASITADAPATVTPWAGSPGCVYVFGDHLQTGQSIVNIDVFCTYHLRGRV